MSSCPTSSLSLREERTRGTADLSRRSEGICIDEYNDAICRVATNCHIDLADIAKCRFNYSELARVDKRYETLDGTHPTAKDHQLIADEWIACLSRLL